jgi:hypothetical protein
MYQAKIWIHNSQPGDAGTSTHAVQGDALNVYVSNCWRACRDTGSPIYLLACFQTHALKRVHTPQTKKMSCALFLKIICQRDSPLKHAANTPNKNTANIQQMTNILILSNQFLSVLEPVSRDARTSFIWTQKYQSILSHVYLPVLQSNDC